MFDGMRTVPLTFLLLYFSTFGLLLFYFSTSSTSLLGTQTCFDNTILVCRRSGAGRNASAISVRWLAVCQDIDPSAGLALRALPTYRKGQRPSIASSRLGRTKLHAPMFSGSS